MSIIALLLYLFVYCDNVNKVQYEQDFENTYKKTECF